MRNAGFTKQERTFIAIMRIWAVAFAGAGILFAVYPDGILNYINGIGRSVFGWTSPPLVLGAERFWLVLAVALLAVLAYLCAIAQRNLVRNIGYARPVILAKLVSTTGFAVCLAAYDRQFFYLVGAVADGLIFLITWRTFARAQKSRA